jgi:hypothetical protein
LKNIPHPAGRVCVAHSIPRHAANHQLRMESTALDQTVAFVGDSAWIGHLSYAKVAGIATFDGRYVVGWAQTAAERRRPGANTDQPTGRIRSLRADDFGPMGFGVSTNDT